MARERAATSELTRSAGLPPAAGGGAGRPRPGSHRKSRSPRGHWVLVGLVMLVFAVGLVVEGYTRGVLGENSADQPRV